MDRRDKGTKHAKEGGAKSGRGICSQDQKLTIPVSSCVSSVCISHTNSSPNEWWLVNRPGITRVKQVCSGDGRLETVLSLGKSSLLQVFEVLLVRLQTFVHNRGSMLSVSCILIVLLVSPKIV